MKQAKEYAKRVKRLFKNLTRKYGKPPVAEPTDPILELVEGILAINTTVHKAQTVLSKLLQQMVDLNELRVTPAMELAALIGTGVPMAAEKSQWIVDALNDIRKRQEVLDLRFLRDRGRREAREYLESLKGVDRSAAARVVQRSLGGHAIPVDELTLYVLRKNEIVDDSTDAETVQRFLEHHVTAANGSSFTELLGKYVAVKGARIPVEDLPALLNPPPAPEPETAAVKETPKKKAAEKTAPVDRNSGRKSPTVTRKAKRKTTTKARKAAKKTTRSLRSSSKKKGTKKRRKSVRR